MDERNINSIMDPANAEEGEDEGFDLEKAKELVGFVLRAGRRRRVLAIVTFLTVAGLGLTAAATMPKTYSAQVKILAQPSSGIRTLSGANQDLNRVDEPTKNVASLIMRHENLVALVKQASLVERFEDSRAPALRLKDRIITWIFGPTSEGDKLRIVVAKLEKQLDIFADETTLIITVDWPNAQMAFDLATLVQKNFLEARYDSDLAVINDSIAVLQEHAKTGDEKVNAALADYQKAAAAAPPPPGFLSVAPAWRGYAAPAQRPNGAAITTPTVDPSVALGLEEVRLKMRALQQERQSMQDSLRQQLTQAQLTLMPKHPTIMALQQKIDAMGQPSPELLRLKDEERALLAQVPAAAPTAPVPVSPQAAAVVGEQQHAIAQASPPPSLPSPLQLRPGVEDGPTRLAQSKLESAIQGYEASVANIDAANVELDIMRRAYKYRYTIISPAELPTKTKKPVAQVVAVVSVLGGGLLAFVLAAIADVLGGQVLEPWQVRRRLKLEVLGEIDRMAS
jgi:uncharacterized protein involved in exopolysaccharide biosynthesis